MLLYFMAPYCVIIEVTILDQFSCICTCILLDHLQGTSTLALWSQLKCWLVNHCLSRKRNSNYTILRHLVETPLVKQLGWKSISHIYTPKLAPIPTIDSNITSSDVLTNWDYHYVSAKWHSTNLLLAKWCRVNWIVMVRSKISQESCARRSKLWSGQPRLAPALPCVNASRSSWMFARRHSDWLISFWRKSGKGWTGDVTGPLNKNKSALPCPVSTCSSFSCTPSSCTGWFFNYCRY